ncbi:winged helix-turn-helix domain-containing protein [Chitinophaga pendula]|uniref:winged helix-turn-helix domain-containing protein n=1 Tax=Chitinophaga TaxID=79328 RepID=UPI000BAFAAC9|nr:MULTISPECIES: winged helix-turn-helix domain-containing protein [Chitinophaga]ASZ11881.1 transcriptional regulator [Chitinophaga sp. MD30]UCJ05094.1 winged helix-turn-helix domain-containing protein [Chitinophaga pendula]
MRLRLNPLSGKRKYLFGLTLLLSISVICVALSMEGRGDVDMSRREILLRKIGHELLLQSGDSTSRVLPVEKIAENEYQIRFENEFTFQPDSLVNTTRRLLTHDPLAHNYVVNVLNCADSGVVYGYVMSKSGKDDIITCTGRTQPKACYKINIKIETPDLNTAKSGYLLGCLPFLAFAGFLLLKSAHPTIKPVKPQSTSPDNSQHTGMITLGAVLFDARNRKLIINGQPIDLTATETRVLHIFALSPNETIERSRLQKEIWEDEGVIVGRSLDMFISKLRKKLELNPDINIVVVRGKGYKLEITA